jgi:hypothetical protein
MHLRQILAGTEGRVGTTLDQRFGTFAGCIPELRRKRGERGLRSL